MRMGINTALLVIVAALQSGVGNPGYATLPRVAVPYSARLEPELPLVKGAPITLYLSYEIDTVGTSCAVENGSYSLSFVNPRDYGDTLSHIDYQVYHGNTFKYSGLVRVSLPDADTCCLHLRLSSGTCRADYRYYFIISGGKVEFQPDFHMPMPARYQSLWKRPKEDGHSDPDRDTLTQEHLQTEYEVIIDLRDSSHYKLARKILGSIPDSCLYNKGRGLYKIRTTLENLIMFGDHNFEFEFTTPPPWDKRFGE